MEIGTAEPILTPKKKRIRRRGGLSGGGNGSKRGGNGGGGGGGGSDDSNPSETDRTRPSKSRIATVFLLLVVMMTFGGLIAAYVVIATNRVAEWRPFALPIPVWISTVLIIASSFTYNLAKRATFAEDQARAKKWLIATTALGAAFISSQLLAWVELVRLGVYVAGNPYAGFFYILTAVHAVHVLGGIIALGVIVLRSWEETSYHPELERRKELAQAVGWYWHFMDLLWIVLFVLLGFWR